MRLSARKYLAVAAIAARERLVYRADLAASTAFLLLFLFIFTGLWRTVLSDGMTVEGFCAAGVVWYLVVTESIMIGTPSLGRRIAEEIRSGSFAVSLLRPVHYVWMHLAAFLGESAVTVTLNLVVGGMVALGLVGLPVGSAASAASPDLLTGVLWGGLVAVAIVGGLILNFTLMASLAFLALWFEDNEPFFWILNKLQLILGGVLFPLEFFPATLGTIAAALPFAYIFHGPARLAVGGDGAMAVSVLTGQGLWLVVLGMLTCLLHRHGIRQVSVNGG